MKGPVRGVARGQRKVPPSTTAQREQAVVVLEQDVLALTPRGTKEIRESDTSLSSAQLDLLVRVDGLLSVAEIASETPGRAPEAVVKGFEDLMRRGLVAPAPKIDPDSLDFTNFFSAQELTEPGADSRKKVTQQVVAGVASLKRHGYFVRIARRAGALGTAASGRRPVSVVVEDEPALAKLLKQYLSLEGFSVRVAGNRDQIVAAFREQPVPDLVLLDIMLPDADGFDVLARMRQHPSLRGVPVIMLTAKATREAVLKGLALGADGYITKPFEVDVLVKAVDTVLRRSEK